MEAVIWGITIFAVILVIVIYVITSVGKYSNSFIGKVFTEQKKEKDDMEERKS